MAESMQDIVESCVNVVMPLQDRLHIKLAGKKPLTALETGQQIHDTSASFVLGSTQVPGWLSIFAHNFATWIAKCWCEGVGAIVLLAVKGGPASDKEIELIRVLLPHLGGIPGMVNEAEGSIGRKWTWQIKRSKTQLKNIYVSLRVYHKAESVKLGLEKTVHPYEYMGERGNYRRVAVVSCPFLDRNGCDAHALVNEQLRTKMADMIDRCRRKGFAPKWDDGHAEWREFFKS
eukprot:m.133064 g.133064  ORF g.133064 m.133064 type:complete len:232 (+) comp29650_c1_seq1:302-997(+)